MRDRRTAFLLYEHLLLPELDSGLRDHTSLSANAAHHGLGYFLALLGADLPRRRLHLFLLAGVEGQEYREYGRSV